MQIKSVRQINVTVLFPEPLNHALISIPTLVDKLKTGQEEEDKTTVLEAPGLKVLTFPNRKKEIIFEQHRLLVNDKEAAEPNKSKIFGYLDNGFRETTQDRKKIAAYGFNFDALVADGKKGNLVGKRLTKAIRGNIEEQGANIVFTAKEKRFTLKLNPAGTPQELVVYFNVHQAKDSLPNKKTLQNEMRAAFEELQSVVQRL